MKRPGLIRTLRAGVALGTLLVMAGCALILGLDPPAYDDGSDADADAAPGDGAVGEAGGDASADATPAVFADPSRWSVHTLPSGGYAPGAFDGRFVYFIREFPPLDAGEPGAQVLRYDRTNPDFTGSAGWSALSLPRREDIVRAMAFDGRYLILSEYGSGAFYRYDTVTRPDFTDLSSWETLDAAAIAPNASLYTAAADLGGSTYFAAAYAGPPVLRHVAGPLDAGWEVFDSASLGCQSAVGAACAGAFVYFGPSVGTGDCFFRYDTRGPFAGAGFESFRLEDVAPSFYGYRGVVAANAYVYLTRQTANDLSSPLLTLRRPAEGPLDGGWEVEPSGGQPFVAGHAGGAFDGQYVYFPSSRSEPSYRRYDTSKPWSDPASWETVVGVAVGVDGVTHFGAVFDGVYVYFPPITGAGVIRFRANDAGAPVPPRCSYQ